MKTKLLTSLIVAIILIGCNSGNDESVIEVSGIIESTDINISSKVTGELRKVNFTEGEKVSANDTIAELDKETILLQIEQLKAGVALNEAQYKMAVKGFRTEDIRQAEQSMKAAKSNFELAEYEKNNMESLFKSGSVSEKQWKDITNKYNSTLAQYKASEEMYNKMKRGNREEDIASAKARFEQSKAQLALTEKQFKDSYIKAPNAGIITNQVFEIGELVLTGATVFTITELDKVYLMVYVSENNLGKVKYGQTADVVVDSHPEKIFKGKVTYISSVAEFTPKNIQTKDDRLKQVFGVKLEIENKDGILKPGMPADAKIIIN